MKILKVSNSFKGGYLFVQLEIKENAAPQNVEFLLSKDSQQIKFLYELKARNLSNQPQGFSSKDVVYLITPDRFANGNLENDVVPEIRNDFDPNDPEKRSGGDLQGIIDHLDYLQELGITAIWLNPILENSGKVSYHGYATTNYYKVDPRFGSNADYKRLVEECHKRNIKVIHDHIANHCGIEHPWLSEYPTQTWIHGTPENHLVDKHFMHAFLDPNADEKSAKMMKEFWFVDVMPDLDQRDEHLSKYLIQNMIWWMEYAGIDGVREDTYPYPYQEFLTDFAVALKQEYPNSNFVGETWILQPAYLANWQKNSPSKYALNTECESFMDFPLMQALRDFLEEKGNLNDVFEVLSMDFLYGNPNELMVFVGNHDNTRAAFLNNNNHQKSKLAFGIALTTRGIPQILYGEEIGMYGGPSHVLLREKFPGGFPMHNRSAFVENERKDYEQEMFVFFQKLIKLRTENEAFHNGKLIHYPTHWWQNDVYVYFRFGAEKDFMIVANGSDKQTEIGFENQMHYLEEYKSMNAYFKANNISIEENLRLKLNPYQFEVFELKK